MYIERLKMYYSVIQVVFLVTLGLCLLAVVTFYNVGTLFTLQVATPNKFTVAIFSESHNLPTEASVTAHNITVPNGIRFSVTLPANSSQGTVLLVPFTVAR